MPLLTCGSLSKCHLLEFALIVIASLAVACGGDDNGGGAPLSPPASSNHLPVAADDVAITQMNVSVDINVLSNDVDSDGDTLQLGIVSQGAEGGAVSVNPNGTVRYTPLANASGGDSFTYTINDGKGGSATASVSVRVDFPAGQVIQRVSVSTNGTQGNQDSWMGAISSGGGFVAFYTSASNLLPSGSSSGHILIHNRVTMATELVTANVNGLPATAGGQQPSVSSTGRYVAFSSSDSSLVVGDTNGQTDIFVRDLQQGITRRVSISSTGTQGNSGSMAPSISGDGRYIAFWSLASNLVQNDLTGEDIFVHDTNTGITSLVSIDPAGNQMGGGAFDNGPSISYDGRYVAFSSLQGQIFVRDRQTNQTTMVSVSSAGVPANGVCSRPTISGNGRAVVFASTATNLVSGDSNGVRDVFVHDLQTGVTTRVSVASDGTEANGEVPDLNKPSISEDGRFVAFLSAATNLVSGDTNGVPDVFVRDRQTNQTVRVSVASNGAQTNGPSGDSVLVSMSANGQYVAFSSQATNLVAGDTNGWGDVFVAPNPLAP